ncbi:DUF805 domain-containing protein [Thiotrichales bacterium 19S3-7]|nr:DUF805 domain-containing protein [Thiotrichales bacterium 19S3-7]MCF6801746.1 DUF805 domain-containing protein [Thiotrichales bacterium 19S3-11]
MSAYEYLKLDKRLARVEYLSLILFWGALFEVSLLLTFVVENYTHYLGLSNFLISITCALYLWFILKVILCMIRRFHDINLTGWYTLVLLIPGIGYLAVIILCLIPGTQGANQYAVKANQPTSKMYWLIFFSAVVIVLTSIGLAYLFIHLLENYYH